MHRMSTLDGGGADSPPARSLRLPPLQQAGTSAASPPRGGALPPLAVPSGEEGEEGEEARAKAPAGEQQQPAAAATNASTSSTNTATSAAPAAFPATTPAQAGAPLPPLQQERVALSVRVGVGLKLKCSWPDGEHTGEFEVVGPDDALGKLTARGASVSGQISPKATVTVPDEHRELAGIPTHAHSFAYCFPSSDAEVVAQLRGDSKWLARNEVRQHLLA